MTIDEIREWCRDERRLHERCPEYPVAASVERIEYLLGELDRYRRAFHCPTCGGRGWYHDWHGHRNVKCECGAVKLRAESKYGG
jgi:hypothetical protein